MFPINLGKAVYAFECDRTVFQYVMGFLSLLTFSAQEGGISDSTSQEEVKSFWSLVMILHTGVECVQDDFL